MYHWDIIYYQLVWKTNDQKKKEEKGEGGKRKEEKNPEKIFR